MNERIKELANQAWEYAHRNSQDGDGQFGWLYRDKFAELIIRECCDIFVELRTRPAELAVKDVKKHFGIEE